MLGPVSQGIGLAASALGWVLPALWAGDWGSPDDRDKPTLAYEVKRQSISNGTFILHTRVGPRAPDPDMADTSDRSGTSALRIIFMGTAGLSCVSLEALADTPGFQVVGVVTQPDRPKGRELRVQPSPVKALALQRGLPVLQPERARDPAFAAQLEGLRPDLIAVAAFGQILAQSILDLPRLGCLNVHTSLLPKYRGAAPIQWAILNGDSETGVTIMEMDAGLDTGSILTQEATPIRPEDDAQVLYDRLAAMGARLLAQTIPGYAAGAIRPRPQPKGRRELCAQDQEAGWGDRLERAGPGDLESRPRAGPLAGRLHVPCRRAASSASTAQGLAGGSRRWVRPPG